jgi:hypothetical protein
MPTLVTLLPAVAAAAAAAAAAAGVPVQYHEEAGECHSYAVLALPHLLRKSQVILNYVKGVALAAAAAAAVPEPAAAAAVLLPAAETDKQEHGSTESKL